MFGIDNLVKYAIVAVGVAAAVDTLGKVAPVIYKAGCEAGNVVKAKATELAAAYDARKAAKKEEVQATVAA